MNPQICVAACAFCPVWLVRTKLGWKVKANENLFCKISNMKYDVSINIYPQILENIDKRPANA